ncbi:helix-turn-helix domain-containing protein [Fluviibacterium sp. DFM31]|uniref:Helix-turn-helix domain-containing protein n=1 Tax=Meridianimarinicoccus marinus TaxID=3231483 RepID=A0ABV3LAE7_9RHOB
MPRSALTGTRIRERRTMLGLKQADLARTVEISPSYLNLIEHNRRRIGGALLSRIARTLKVEVANLTQGAETEQVDQLSAAAAAHPEVNAEIDRIDEFVGRFPGWAALMSAQQRRLVQLEHHVASLVDRLAHDPFLSDSLHDILSKVSAIQSTASILVETDDLDEVWQRRFHRNLHADSGKLAEGASSLVDYLDAEGDAELGMVSPQEELESFLNSRAFHIDGLETEVPDLAESILDQDKAITSRGGKDLVRTYLWRYREEALAMPLEDFTEAAEELGYDPARLAQRFGCDIPAVFRRLASMPSDQGSRRIGLVVCDGAGALILRKATELLPLPRFGAACALWPLYRALTRPMAPVRAVLEHAGRPGYRFLCYAMSHASYPLGFGGPAVYEASMILVPPALVEPTEAEGPVEVIGTSCRICPVENCAARREPSILSDGFDTAAQLSQ